jgi:hypothetical protein
MAARLSNRPRSRPEPSVQQPAAASVSMGAVLDEPADHHTGNPCGDEHDPHGCLGVSEHVAEADVISVVERHHDDRGDKHRGDDEPQ